MAKTKTSTEEIIEKKESSPIASASLILSSVAILASIVFCLLEIIDYRTGLSARAADSDHPGMTIAKEDLGTLKQRVNRILNNQALPDDEEEFEDDEEEFEDDEEEFEDDEEEFEDDEEEFEEEEDEDL